MSKTPGCMFRKIFAQIDNDDRDALIDLLLSDRGHVDVARTMTDAGHSMSEHTVRSHRKSDCTCGRF